MDGIHDLGGKQGHGPVDVDEDETPFHHDWEGREWGIAQSARPTDITIDWWRHCRELILPEDYLGRPYFDSWAQTDFSVFLELGRMTFDEIATGHAQADGFSSHPPAEPMTLDQVLERVRAQAIRFDAEIDASPTFAVGQVVRTQKHGHGGHTRLPQYARDRIGRIHARHGAHVFPDTSAEGTEIHQHLYSVVFDAAELWPEASGSRDKVYLDLWEAYLLAEPE